eukprot:CAMPEP_0201569502 /NCGR_PEP_ID=MMETSP0190_2-20130828/11206_1 /ASSEMBLY_ACC=CAM_ASM_000263 /TAXON_ID=37353 /ORGANISM="Rosalina sp." /LENGTH=483 /DNA_ID=CAMNT_0047991875 /DNA_START=26 /DNA_END=1474 /DNA_ORIENTATION=+
MAEQTVHKVKSKRSGFGSGLTERLGGEGKIQWEQTQKKIKENNIGYDPPFLHLFILVIILSCITEYYYSSGSSTLILGLLITGIYSIRAKPHDNIPMGDGFIPFFGHSLNVAKHWNDFFDEEARQCLKLEPKRAYYSTSIPTGRSFIFLVDPDLIDLLFRLKFGDADKGSEVRAALSPMFGKGIFSSDGTIWKKHRAIASRMFTVRSLRDYMFKVFIETTDLFIQKCEEIFEKDGEVDIYDMYNRLTLEAFTQVAFGVPLGTIACAPQEVQFSKSFDEGFQICTKRFFDVTWPVQKLLNIGREKTLKKHLKIINEFAKDIIHKKKEHFKRLQQKKLNKTGNDENLKERYDLMSLFLKDDQNVKDEELRDVALNFIIAGRDTTAQLLSWFSYLLTQPENSKVEENIMNEINQYIGDSVDLDYNVINNCQYLESSFLETLRLRPSVPHLVRYAKTDIPLPTGNVIRKGNGIVIPTYAMGRMPWIW